MNELEGVTTPASRVTNPKEHPGMMTLEEAAAHTGRALSTVRKAARNGNIKDAHKEATRQGERWLLPIASVNEYWGVKPDAPTPFTVAEEQHRNQQEIDRVKIEGLKQRVADLTQTIKAQKGEIEAKDLAIVTLQAQLPPAPATENEGSETSETPSENEPAQAISEDLVRKVNIFRRWRSKDKSKTSQTAN